MNITPFLQIAHAIDHINPFVDLSVFIDKIDVRPDNSIGVTCLTQSLDTSYFIESFNLQRDCEDSS